MSNQQLYIYCDHISTGAVHCNRYKVLAVGDLDRTVREYIEESSWSVDGTNIYCHEHS